MKYLGPALIFIAFGFATIILVPSGLFDVQTFSEVATQPGLASAQSNIDTDATSLATTSTSVDDRLVVQHVPLPKQVKAIYMTACVAGTPSFRQQLIALAQETEINSIVIDIKDYSGTISFAPKNPAWQPAWIEAQCGAPDMPALLQMLHDNDIYVIGRITVFQDPFAANQSPQWAVKKADGITNWKDGKGLSFIDVAATDFWDHIVDLSVDAYNIGFDELNYDYVRYPSDGNMQDISFPLSLASEYGADKQANLEAFFKYLNQQLSQSERFAAVRHTNTGRASSTPYTSVDLFGMTTTNFDDLSIGQVQERAVPYFDFVAPMVYPSHYPNSFLGLGNPNNHPYKVVNYAMQSGVNRLLSSTTPIQGFVHEPINTTNASGTVSFTGRYSKPVHGPDKFRTWIQDFNYGGIYDADDVRAQIQASYDAGVMSWMLWDPANKYTPAALRSPQSTQIETQ